MFSIASIYCNYFDLPFTAYCYQIIFSYVATYLLKAMRTMVWAQCRPLLDFVCPLVCPLGTYTIEMLSRRVPKS